MSLRQNPSESKNVQNLSIPILKAWKKLHNSSEHVFSWSSLCSLCSFPFLQWLSSCERIRPQEHLQKAQMPGASPRWTGGTNMRHAEVIFQTWELQIWKHWVHVGIHVFVGCIPWDVWIYLWIRFERFVFQDRPQWSHEVMGCRKFEIQPKFKSNRVYRICTCAGVELINLPESRTCCQRQFTMSILHLGSFNSWSAL